MNLEPYCKIDFSNLAVIQKKKAGRPHRDFGTEYIPEPPPPDEPKGSEEYRKWQVIERKARQRFKLQTGARKEL